MPKAAASDPTVAAAPRPAGLHTRDVALVTGDLRLTWQERGWALDDLCSFAARYNPRRGFLIVSTVLGRHVPARPRAVRGAADALSAAIRADLAGPVLFIGLAETAITLGHSVHAGWRRHSGRSDALFLHSTRQLLGCAPLVQFTEPHSHAAAHLLYPPAPAIWPRPLSEFRSLVLVDDEVTTGSTFVNLARQLAPLLPGLEQITTAVLTDWTGGAGYLAQLPVTACGVSLLAGAAEWRPAQATGADTPPPGGCNALGQLDQRRNFGRLGTVGEPLDLGGVLAGFGPPADALHVIGTGELHYPAFLLAEALEQAGHDVLLQAVTRSPARIGGAITAALTVADNYAADAANYLYNLDQTAPRRRVIGHETAPGSLDPALLRPSDWGTVDFGALP